MSKILTALSLRPAPLAVLAASLRDGGGEERQPAPRKFVLRDERAPRPGAHTLDAHTLDAHTLEVWQGQDPAQRIANTLLLCAIRDRAEQVVIEPQAREVRVQFVAPGGVREQKLPRFALQPIVEHYQSLAPSDENAEEFRVSLVVDEQLYQVQFSALSTHWGEGVTVQFSPQT